MMNSLQIHFDGDIATNHQVSMRALGRTLFHLQNALDRAYIENKYGELWKHARMRVADYKETQFLVLPPQEGGYIIDFIAKNEITKKILDRVGAALAPAFEEAIHEGEQKAKKIVDQIGVRKAQVDQGLIYVPDYNKMLEAPSPLVVRKYGDRSINREIDQVLSLIRSKYSGDSYLELVLNGSQSTKYTFNRAVSSKFHNIVTARSLGDPVLYRATVISLDHKNSSGKIVNADNDKTAIIHFCDDVDFMSAKEYLGTEDVMSFYGSPLIEYGAFDPQAGDIYFIALGENG